MKTNKTGGRFKTGGRQTVRKILPKTRPTETPVPVIANFQDIYKLKKVDRC